MTSQVDTAGIVVLLVVTIEDAVVEGTLVLQKYEVE